MFYDKFVSLCKEKGVAPTRAALDIGLSKSAPFKWRTTGAIPNGETVNKLAEYFSVSTDVLLGEETKKAPTGGERTVSDEEIKFALFGGDSDITDAMYDEVKRFAQMVKLREEVEREKK